MTDESLFYKIALFAPNGEEIITKSLRVYPLLRRENEMAGRAKGIELARDAMFHAGFWDKAREFEIEEQRKRLAENIKRDQEQLDRLKGVAV